MSEMFTEARSLRGTLRTSWLEQTAARAALMFGVLTEYAFEIEEAPAFFKNQVRNANK